MKSKTIFICRDSFESKYIASFLKKKGLIDTLVIESGKKARGKKLKRQFKGASPIRLISSVIDLIPLYIYTKMCEYKLLKVIKSSQYPDIDTYFIDDVNDQNSLDIIKKTKNPTIIVFGVGIIKKYFFETRHKSILNIHTGVVPEYRNVHSDFWAYKNKDFNKIGVSIIYLDLGIDTGDIALINKLKIKKGDSLFNIKSRLVKLAAKTAGDSLLSLKEGKLKRNKQKRVSRKSYFVTPRLIHFVQIVSSRFF